MLAVLALALTGCGGVKEQLGLTRSAPDEFTVLTKAPLVLPPDFTLRPPRRGARPRGDLASQQRARRALLSGSAASEATAGAGSSGEDALLKRANAADAAPDIRALINRETAQFAAASKTFIDMLIFWQEQEEPATMVDADKEARRLKENAALGKNANEGEVPIIRHRKKGWLEGLF